MNWKEDGYVVFGGPAQQCLLRNIDKAVWDLNGKT